MLPFGTTAHIPTAPPCSWPCHASLASSRAGQRVQGTCHRLGIALDDVFRRVVLRGKNCRHELELIPSQPGSCADVAGSLCTCCWWDSTGCSRDVPPPAKDVSKGTPSPPRFFPFLTLLERAFLPFLRLAFIGVPWFLYAVRSHCRYALFERGLRIPRASPWLRQLKGREETPGRGHRGESRRRYSRGEDQEGSHMRYRCCLHRKTTWLTRWCLHVHSAGLCHRISPSADAAHL